MKEVNRLAIIPARYNSKRIKKKNIKNFFNKPIIYYSIKSAKKSNLFLKIHVSSENNQILKISSSLGIKTDFKRPRYLSKDSTSIIDVLRFVVKEYEKRLENFDEIWLVYPCAPLTTSKDLISAAKIFNKTNKKYPLMTFKEYEAPIEWAFKKKNNFFLPIEKKKLLNNSQSLKKNYYESGSFVIFKKKHIFQKKKIFNKYYGFIFPKDKAVDIDTQEDWDLAELLFMKKRLKKY